MTLLRILLGLLLVVLVGLCAGLASFAIPLPEKGVMAEARRQGYVFLGTALLAAAGAAAVLVATRRPGHGTKCLAACGHTLASLLAALAFLGKGLAPGEGHRLVWWLGAVAGLGSAVFGIVEARHYYRRHRQSRGVAPTRDAER